MSYKLAAFSDELTKIAISPKTIQGLPLTGIAGGLITASRGGDAKQIAGAGVGGEMGALAGEAAGGVAGAGLGHMASKGRMRLEPSQVDELRRIAKGKNPVRKRLAKAILSGKLRQGALVGSALGAFGGSLLGGGLGIRAGARAMTEKKDGK